MGLRLHGSRPTGETGAQEKLQNLLQNLSRAVPLVFDLCGDVPGSLASEQRRGAFFEKLVSQLMEGRRTALILAGEQFAAGTALEKMRGHCEWILMIRRSGETHYAQFVSAPLGRAPETFLPRLVSTEEGRIIWSIPVEPREEHLEPKKAVQRLEEKLTCHRGCSENTL